MQAKMHQAQLNRMLAAYERAKQYGDDDVVMYLKYYIKIRMAEHKKMSVYFDMLDKYSAMGIDNDRFKYIVVEKLYAFADALSNNQIYINYANYNETPLSLNPDQIEVVASYI